MFGCVLSQSKPSVFSILSYIILRYIKISRYKSTQYYLYNGIPNNYGVCNGKNITSNILKNMKSEIA